MLLFNSMLSRAMPDNDFLVVLCTCPDKETAQRLAQHVVAAKLAACVNSIGPIDSLYHWQGTIESAAEYLMLIKTQRRHYPALEQMLLTQHPYDTPEVIALPITQGAAGYLGWLAASLEQAPQP